jgi:exopolysaccharide biosynthesis polyprenyl glycosylphosphotransferase
LVALDLCCVIAAVALGYYLRFGFDTRVGKVTTYLGLGLVLAAIWVTCLQYVGGYEIRHLATGPEEAKRVLRASGIAVSVLAIYCFVTQTLIARGYVVGVVPIGAALLLLERTAVRAWVRRRRAAGKWAYRILAVGTSESVRHLLTVTQRAKGAGLQVVGACAEDVAVGAEIAPEVPVLGGIFDAAQVAAAIGANVVAVTGSGMGPTSVRELGWQLEGTGRGLVMAPALTEIAGPRVHVSPVEGLPLVWLEQPQLGRLRRTVKRALDLVLGTLILICAVPVLAGTALAIKMTSRGPVFFRQSRLGLHGEEFWILKFRSMYADAEKRRRELLELNEQDGGGVLFKIRQDPRITPIGRIIRKFSIDELPQLIHVLTGTMSLVGPRPLATEDSTYEGSARRRLLVKPGLTGLWQVSGRSETSWDDAVRLDLYYVENWSIGLDLSILVRTLFCVLARKGAY